MNLKNYFLKKRQLKSMQKSKMDINFYLLMPYHCPTCYWATDNITTYITHLENHLKKKKEKKVKKNWGVKNELFKRN